MSTFVYENASVPTFLIQLLACLFLVSVYIFTHMSGYMLAIVYKVLICMSAT